jgi:hypothetical protein
MMTNNDPKHEKSPELRKSSVTIYSNKYLNDIAYDDWALGSALYTDRGVCLSVPTHLV